MAFRRMAYVGNLLEDCDDFLPGQLAPFWNFTRKRIETPKSLLPFGFGSVSDSMMILLLNSLQSCDRPNEGMAVY